MNEENVTKDVKDSAADKLATAAFVLGIISLFSTLCCCPFVFSAIGITLALLSKGAEKVLRPRAKTGLILSIVGFGVSIIIIVFTVAFPIVMIKTNPEYKKSFIENYEQSLEMNEDMLKEIYGDDVYEEMFNLLDNF